MVIFSNCKVNLGLHILNRRPDGFHNIETVFIPVPWKDVIELERADKLSLSTEGKKIDGPIEDNFCIKAYRLLQKDFDLPPVNFCLLKNIPAGAGLGGGSANATYTIKLLNDFFKLNISDERIKNYAAGIGSDCAFFAVNKTSIATSRGEVMEEIEPSLTGKHLVIVYPGVHVNTALTYKTFAAKNLYSKHKPLRDLVELPHNRWKKEIMNDFEQVVFKDHPVLEKIKHQLYELKAFYAAMSGSGSALFGIFDKQVKNGEIAGRLKLPENEVFASIL